jgi:hypothetical protein
MGQVHLPLCNHEISREWDTGCNGQAEAQAASEKILDAVSFGGQERLKERGIGRRWWAIAAKGRKEDGTASTVRSSWWWNLYAIGLSLWMGSVSPWNAFAVDQGSIPTCRCKTPLLMLLSDTRGFTSLPTQKDCSDVG